MKEFILVFIGGEPEEQEDLPKHYGEYGAFMRFLIEGNHFKNGIPADASDGRMVDKQTIRKNGDFMSSENRVGGIMIISANNIDHAAEIARRNPIIKNGGKILVRPIKEM